MLIYVLKWYVKKETIVKRENAIQNVFLKKLRLTAHVLTYVRERNAKRDRDAFREIVLEGNAALGK